LARELKVPVVALSQLSRAVEARTDKRPMLSDLRESGAIEAEADLVMFIYRDSYYKRKDMLTGDEDLNADSRGVEKMDPTELIIAKQRNGPTGTAVVGFISKYTRFENYDRRADAPADIEPMEPPYDHRGIEPDR